MIGSVLGTTIVAVFGYMVALYVLAQIRGRNDLVDVAWGPGFVVMAVAAASASDAWTNRAMLMTALVSLWAVRLAVHIGLRNRGKPEDFRYAAWRKEWGDKAWLYAFFKVFMLQGAFMLLVGIPVWAVGAAPASGWTWLDAMGVLFFAVGFGFEAMGDEQLRRYRRTPERPVLDTGLWRFTRHPNYFGEALLWWGLGIIGFAGTGYPWVLVGPATIHVLLRFVSGVPMLERKYDHDPHYQEYKRRTSPFLPRLPRR